MMTRLILVNLYRMRKYRLTRHLLLPVCFFSIVCDIALIDEMSDSDTIMALSGSAALCDIMSGLLLFLSFFLIPVLIHFIEHSFGDRTAAHERMSGYSIHQMLMGRIVTVSLSVVAVVVVFAAAVVLLLTLKNGWNTLQYGGDILYDWNVVTAADIAEWSGLCLFALWQFVVITVLTACICKNEGFALLLALGINLLSGLAADVGLEMLLPSVNGNLLEFTYAFLPGYQMAAVESEIRIVTDTMADNSQLLFLSEYLPWIFMTGILAVMLLYVFAYYAVKKRL